MQSPTYEANATNLVDAEGLEPLGLPRERKGRGVDRLGSR
jgi:hypothetical protein